MDKSTLNIITNGPIAGLVIFAILTALFAIFVYRQTNPVISRLQKYLLTGLRTISLLLLLLVIYGTIYRQNFFSSQKPVLAVIVDNSASMALSDQNGDRTKSVNSILNSSWLKDIENGYDIRYFSFAGDTKPLDQDSLDFIGDATNIAQPFTFVADALAHENLSDILLISDGNYNDGGNPVRTVENIGIPIHTIGIGSVMPNPDLSIIATEHNKTVYLDEPTPIKIQIQNQGYNNIKVPFNVALEDEMIKSDIISIATSPSETEYTFEYTPSSTGRKKLELRLTPQSNEQSTENNKKTIYLDVIKSKLKISLLAGGVSPDISFIKNSLLANTRYELTTAILNKSGSFYSPQPKTDFVEETDIFILINFPTQATPGDLINRIADKAKKKQSPILYFEGQNIDRTKFLLLENYLPFRGNFKQEQEKNIHVEMSQAGALNPILKFNQPQGMSGGYSLADLPPIYSSINDVKPWPNSEILAFSAQNSFQNTSSPNNKNPFILTRNNQNQKSATIFAYGLWRWALYLADRNLDFSPYNTLMNNLVRWLEPDNNGERLQVELNKTNFNLAEKINANIELLDTDHIPIESGEIVVTLKAGNSEQIKSVTNSGNGKYFSSFNVATPGDYILKTSAYENGQVIETTETNFTVGEYAIELTDTRMQQSTLENLSQISGGFFSKSDSAFALKSHLVGKERKVNNIFSIELWNNYFVLLTIILLLSTEWLLRKRKGML